MQIWVDADACPRAIKEILYRAAERRQIPMILVANRLLWTPPSPVIRALRVAHGFDVADREILEQVQAGDLVVTGTPSGVGMAADPPRFLRAGDRMRVEIDGLGELDNTIRARP